MGCEYCKYWKGGEKINGALTCNASQSFRDNFCGVYSNSHNRGSNFTPKKKKRRRCNKTFRP